MRRWWCPRMRTKLDHPGSRRSNIRLLADDATWVDIDEAQSSMMKIINLFCNDLATRYTGRRSPMDMDLKGNPFGPMPGTYGYCGVTVTKYMPFVHVQATWQL